ncbi:single-stranded DNA-binding protein [Nocardia niwae]|uniref:single-stranded DNA-binding protein n=1 Tax=Nocardia niwae TaxID=626084 RepID=UPI0007A50978|nr:single-stranded DNA-binding protein [Nocardia niwae]
MTDTTIVGNTTAPVELRFTPGGKAVANFTVARTNRYLDKNTNEWKDGDTLFLRCTLWGQPAENLAESNLPQGTRVIVTGKLEQRSFETREGEKRTVIELKVDEIGPSVKGATVAVTKTNGNGGGRGNDEPWGASKGSSNFRDDEAPF